MKTPRIAALAALALTVSAVAPPAVPTSAFAAGSSADSSPALEDPTGGAWYTCPALGVLFGFQVSTGQIVGGVNTLFTAGSLGCL